MKTSETRATARTPKGNGKARASRGDVDARMLERIRAAAAIVRIRQEALYDRLAERFRQALGENDDGSPEAARVAAHKAREHLVAAGALTPGQGERLMEFVLRDHDPGDNVRGTGDITAACSLACAQCGAKMLLRRTSTVPPCPACATTRFARSA